MLTVKFGDNWYNFWSKKILDKNVSKDQKPSDFKDKNKGVINRIKKIFSQIIHVIVEVFSAIVGSIIGWITTLLYIERDARLFFQLYSLNATHPDNG